MRFELNHHFDVPPQTLAKALLDPELQATLSDIGDLHDRTVQSITNHADGTLSREIRCVLALELTGVARSMLGDADPAWVQHETWSQEGMHCEWKIHPEVAAELLSAAGAIDISGDETSSTRAITGDVKVRVPLYGGKVERWIVEGVSRAYDEEADRVAAWLEREE